MIKKENSIKPIKSKAEFCKRVNIPGQTIRNYFGNFNNLLKLVNIKINTDIYAKGFSKEELIKEIKLKNKNGEIIFLKELIKMSCSIETIRNKFGTIENFQREANIELIRENAKTLSKEEIISIIKEKIKNGKIIYKKDVNKNLASQVARVFGNLEKFQLYINYKFPKHELITDETREKLSIASKKKTFWTKEKIISEVKKGIKNNEIKYKKDIRSKIGLCRDTVILRFGSMKNFEKELGYKFPKAPFIVSEEVKKRNKKRYEKEKKIKCEIYVKQLKDIAKIQPVIKKDLDNILGCNSETIRNLFGGTDKLAEYANIKFAKCPDNRVFKYGGRKGKNEKVNIDYYEIVLGIPFEDRNVPIRCNNGKIYFPDARNKEYNIIMEHDEFEHKYRTVEDQIREKALLDTVGGIIIRIKEEEINNLRNQSTVDEFITKSEKVEINT